MTRRSKTTLTLADMLASPPFNHDELEDLRRRAWIEHGTFIVPVWDRKLSPDEAKLIQEVAERLYGGLKS